MSEYILKLLFLFAGLRTRTICGAMQADVGDVMPVLLELEAQKVIKVHSGRWAVVR